MGLMFPPFETLKTTDGPNTPSFLALIPGPACLWRIDALAVKRSDPRNALQLRTQTPYDGLPYAVLLPANGASLGNGQSEEGRQLVVFSEEFRDQVEVESSPDTLRLSPTWCDYAIGVAAHLEKAGFALTGANLLIRGEVPIGAGLSSSASMEVAADLALTAETGLSINRTGLVRVCQQAEHDFVGMRCGIMDQFISLHGCANHALMFNCARYSLN
jgi:hypothetical protein